MSYLIAIDPGTTKSAYVVLACTGAVIDQAIVPNNELLHWLRTHNYDTVLIEEIAGYGMPVGRDVFQTCHLTGRLREAVFGRSKVKMVARRDVKLELCGQARAKDGNVRQAVIDLYPPDGGGKCRQIGVKAQPGPLYGISSHVWQALALGVAYQRMLGRGECEPATMD